MTLRSSDFPIRIFLDSSILQTMLNYGSFLYDGESLTAGESIHADSEGVKKLEALRFIMQIGYRAPFEFALSENSFNEVRRARDASYLRWAYDVLDHWNICLEEAGPPVLNLTALKNLDSGSIGYLGSGDERLIRDAINFGCDTFLTMENKLPRNGNHLYKLLGLRVESPVGVWRRIEPWVALFH